MANGNGNITSGWNEYQRLVLTELERHNDLIEQINAKFSEISLRLALLEQKMQKITELNKSLRDVEDRLLKVERARDIDAAITKYRKWIIATLVLLSGSIIVPLVKVIFFPGL